MAQIQKGTTYSTVNSTVTVDNLNAHVDGATLLPGAISEQPSLVGNATPGSDQVLLLASGQIKKATVVQALGGVTPSQLLNANNNLSDLASIPTAKVNLSLNNVENKSSETIRSEITSANVTTALGFSPVTPTQLASTSVNAGAGLTGGGPLSASSTISIAALSPSPSGTFGSSAQVPVLTVNNLGQVTSVQTQPIIAFTTSQISAISVNAGVGLTGGGSIASSSTISMAALSPNPAGTYGSSTQIPVLTVNNLGQVTSAQTQPISTVTTGQLGAISVSAGVGLTGGGSLASSSTISLAALSPSPVGTYGSNVQVPTLTVNSFGQVTSVQTNQITSFVSTSQLGALNGAATLGADGKLSSNQIAALTTASQLALIGTSALPVIGAQPLLSLPLSSSSGGTGQSTYSSGQLLIGNSSGGLTPATLTAGSNVSITNGSGSISIAASLEAVYPVGSIYINATNSANPSTLFGFGTWVAFGAGRVPVGFDAEDTNFNAAEKTGGSKDAIVVSHTHSITDPGHTHTSNACRAQVVSVGVPGGVSGSTLEFPSATINSATTGISVNSTGSSGTNANLPPYITVYMWKRTA